FCRELDTPSLPKTHLPVGYCWQNSRCCRSVLRKQHSYIGDFVSHTNDPLSSRAACSTVLLHETKVAAPVRCRGWFGVFSAHLAGVSCFAQTDSGGFSRTATTWDRLSHSVPAFSAPSVGSIRPWTRKW